MVKKNEEPVVKKIGNFLMTSTEMRVSDPTYSKDVWCTGVLKNCIPGPWEAGVLYEDCEEFGIRVAALIVRAKDVGPEFGEVKEVHFCRNGWDEEDFEVGVDSGQAGFYDEAKYPKGKHVSERWFNTTARCTDHPKQAGMLTYGVVSRSGFGDGGYICQTHRNENGQVDFAWITFIED